MFTDIYITAADRRYLQSHRRMHREMIRQADRSKSNWERRKRYHAQRTQPLHPKNSFTNPSLKKKRLSNRKSPLKQYTVCIYNTNTLVYSQSSNRLPKQKSKRLQNAPLTKNSVQQGMKYSCCQSSVNIYQFKTFVEGIQSMN